MIKKSMLPKNQQIAKKIEELNEMLKNEYLELSQKYGFSIEEKKIVFLEEMKKRNKQWKVPLWRYLIPREIRHILSLPFIYSMIIPIVILDFFISIYQFFAFPLYGIPKVKRREYIVYDRHFLDYLNLLQKVHCLYCTYVNGLLAYSVEIAARTERYWCPVKAARKPKWQHSWYGDFADYGNPEEWKQKFNTVEKDTQQFD